MPSTDLDLLRGTFDLILRRLSAAGRRQLVTELKWWLRYTAAVGLIIAADGTTEGGAK